MHIDEWLGLTYDVHINDWFVPTDMTCILMRGFALHDNKHIKRQSARTSKIKTGGLDQYGAECFKHKQCGTASTEGVKMIV